MLTSIFAFMASLVRALCCLCSQFLAQRLASTKGVFQEEMMLERRRARTASASRRSRNPSPTTAPAALALTSERKKDLKGKLTSGAYKVVFSNLLARPSSAASVPPFDSLADLSGIGNETDFTLQAGEAL